MNPYEPYWDGYGMSVGIRPKHIIGRGRPYNRHAPSLDGESIDGSGLVTGRARGLVGGAFIGCMLAQQGGGGDLPAGCRKVLYISSSGQTINTPVIDTGIIPSSSDTIRLRAQWVAGDGRAMSASDASYKVNAIECTVRSGYCTMVFFGGESVKAVDWSSFHDVEIADGKFSIDGSAIHDFGHKGLSCNITMALFSGHRPSGYVERGRCRISSFSIVGKCDMVAVARKENGVDVGYMYDYTTKTLLGNVSSTPNNKFLVGPDI